MICAMGAISVLGFIVWAYAKIFYLILGLLYREVQGINSCYMLESLYIMNYIYDFTGMLDTLLLIPSAPLGLGAESWLSVNMFVRNIDLYSVSDQSAGNFPYTLRPAGRMWPLLAQGLDELMGTFGLESTSETTRKMSVETAPTYSHLLVIGHTPLNINQGKAGYAGLTNLIISGVRAGGAQPACPSPKSEQRPGAETAWFIDWFVGFSEGDGSFSCDRNTNRLFFKIRQKCPKVLYYIKNYFGFGMVSADLDGYFTYTVSSKRNILVLLNVFNGKLILEKTNKRFQSEWLDNYNTWFTSQGRQAGPLASAHVVGEGPTNPMGWRGKTGGQVPPSEDNSITYKGPASFVGFNNAWLCGFTEADGSFGFKVASDQSRKYGCRIRVYWYLDQSYSLQDLLNIQTVLGFGSLERKILSDSSFNSTAPGHAYRLTVMSNKSCKVLCEYFNLYTPITLSKKVRFIRWKRVLNWCLDETWGSRLNEIKHLIHLNTKL
jgi:LAGLIDADG endonuclease